MRLAAYKRLNSLSFVKYIDISVKTIIFYIEFLFSFNPSETETAFSNLFCIAGLYRGFPYQSHEYDFLIPTSMP